jgi:hypothetical protein
MFVVEEMRGIMGGEMVWSGLSYHEMERGGSDRFGSRHALMDLA